VYLLAVDKVWDYYNSPYAKQTDSQGVTMIILGIFVIVCVFFAGKDNRFMGKVKR
jgi:hypothetical protein